MFVEEGKKVGLRSVDRFPVVCLRFFLSCFYMQCVIVKRKMASFLHVMFIS